MFCEPIAPQGDRHQPSDDRRGDIWKNPAWCIHDTYGVVASIGGASQVIDVDHEHVRFSVRLRRLGLENRVCSGELMDHGILLWFVFCFFFVFLFFCFFFFFFFFFFLLGSRKLAPAPPEINLPAGWIRGPEPAARTDCRMVDPQKGLPFIYRVERG